MCESGGGGRVAAEIFDVKEDLEAERDRRAIQQVDLEFMSAYCHLSNT